MRLVLLHGRVERVGDGVLDAEIDRQADRRLLRRRWCGDDFGGADGIDVTLDAGDAAVVDVDLAGDVDGQVARRVDAAWLAAERETGNAEIVRALGFDRRQAALDPREAARLVGELVAQLGRVEIGEQGCEPLGRVVGVADDCGIGEKRRGVDIGGDEIAATVDDVRPHIDLVERFGAGETRFRRVAGGKAHGLPGDGDEDAGEHDVHQPEARARQRNARRVGARMRRAWTRCQGRSDAQGLRRPLHGWRLPVAGAAAGIISYWRGSMGARPILRARDSIRSGRAW